MSNNSRKSIGLAIVASIVLILTAIVMLQENNRKPIRSMEEVIVVEVEPVSMEQDQPSQWFLRDSLVSYAKGLMDVPYLYGSCDPEKGLDCSGFVYHVFGHFGIATPRSSKNFLSAGKAVDTENLKIGDVLVFTGTDANIRVGGHVGIVLSVNDTISFIHSSSGRTNGVTISSLEEPNYKKRFLFARDFISN